MPGGESGGWGRGVWARRVAGLQLLLLRRLLLLLRLLLGRRRGLGRPRQGGG
eukprot:SAG31_NODE_40256_length_282_cov_0.338798_1_plen_51_part_10